MYHRAGSLPRARWALPEGIQKGELRGLQRGIEVALDLKFADSGLALLPLVRAVQDVDVLRAVQESLRTDGPTAATKPDIRNKSKTQNPNVPNVAGEAAWNR